MSYIRNYRKGRSFINELPLLLSRYSELPIRKVNIFNASLNQTPSTALNLHARAPHRTAKPC